MNIQLIKPETQTKLRKPVLIGTGILLICGVGWFTIHAIQTSGLSRTEHIDRISDTVVDAYSGAATDGKVIYGLETIQGDFTMPVYHKLATLSEEFVTFAFPNEQFSYKKSSLRQDTEGTYSFEIESKSQRLEIRFTTTDDKLNYLEILSNKTSIYNYSG